MVSPKAEGLAKVIQHWLGKSPSRNLYALARLSGLSYTNLRSISAGKTEASLDTVLGLVRVLDMEAEDLQDLWQCYATDLQALQAFIPRDRKQWDQPLSGRACRVLLTIAQHPQLVLAELKAMFGEDIIIILEELQEAELISSDAQGLPYLLHTHNIDALALKMPLFRLLLEQVNEKAPFNVLESHFSGVSEEAAQEIEAILEETRLRILCIKQDLRKKGPFTLAWGMILTCFR